MEKVSLDKIVAHAKNTGFVFQGSEIYGGLANTWDFGPLGVELKNNIKKAWWQKFILAQDNVGLDSAILMNPQVWKASGHLQTFNDPMVDCKHCQSRFRADQLIEQTSKGTVNPTTLSLAEMDAYLKEHEVSCPVCGKHDFTPIRQFNLMFKTFQGVVEDAVNTIYLRPETAQGIFVNFKNILRTSRKKIPFGIGQIGKSFRNEITPGNFIFRVREFEQMELQFFCRPGTDLTWYEFWRDYSFNWLIKLGVQPTNLRLREHEPHELSFYSVGTSDIEYEFPFGWGEVWGIADRTDYDLTQHQTFAKTSLEYLDPETNEKYVPYVIEPSVGVERLFLMFLVDSYREEQLTDDTRIVLGLHPALAPIKASILPLTKKLSPLAKEIHETLKQEFACEFDESGSIGKRYRRQDAIGTPFCITVDFESLEDKCVTVRMRDSMDQKRLAISELKEYISQQIKF